MICEYLFLSSVLPHDAIAVVHSVWMGLCCGTSTACFCMFISFLNLNPNFFCPNDAPFAAENKCAANDVCHGWRYTNFLFWTPIATDTPMHYLPVSNAVFIDLKQILIVVFYVLMIASSYFFGMRVLLFILLSLPLLSPLLLTLLHVGLRLLHAFQ